MKVLKNFQSEDLVKNSIEKIQQDGDLFIRPVHSEYYELNTSQLNNHITNYLIKRECLRIVCEYLIFLSKSDSDKIQSKNLQTSEFRIREIYNHFNFEKFIQTSQIQLLNDPISNLKLWVKNYLDDHLPPLGIDEDIDSVLSLIPSYHILAEELLNKSIIRKIHCKVKKIINILEKDFIEIPNTNFKSLVEDLKSNFQFAKNTTQCFFVSDNLGNSRNESLTRYFIEHILGVKCTTSKRIDSLVALLQMQTSISNIWNELFINQIYGVLHFYRVHHQNSHNNQTFCLEEVDDSFRLIQSMLDSERYKNIYLLYLSTLDMILIEFEKVIIH